MSLKEKAKTLSQILGEIEGLRLRFLMGTDKALEQKRILENEEWVRLEDAEQEIEFQKARVDVANEMVTSKQKRIDELKYKLLRVLDVFPRKRQYFYSDSGWVEHYNDDDIDEWKKKFEGLLKEKEEGEAKP